MAKGFAKLRDEMTPKGVNTRVAAFLSIGNALAGVSTFAGGFTFNTAVSLHFASSSCKKSVVVDLLLDAFVLFTLSLVFAVTISIILRSFGPADDLRDNDTYYIATLVIFGISGGLLVGGFVLLDVVLINIGQKGAGKGGIVGICMAALILVICGVCVHPTRSAKEEETEMSLVARPAVTSSTDARAAARAAMGAMAEGNRRT